MSICVNCFEEKGAAEVCPHCGYSGRQTENGVYLKPGTSLLGRYMVGEVLGQGGFGITYLGFDSMLNRKIAIKEYYPTEFVQRNPGDSTVMPYTGQTENEYIHGKQKFIEEARTLARFSEIPGIVSIIDCIETNDTAYIVMQYLVGMTLKEYLKSQGGILSVKQSVDIILPVVDALAQVHKAGIIHRDISPDNIFITNEYLVKLLDFGAARQSVSGDASLSIMLKRGFAPEEQYRRKGSQGPWTDVYALSATLYRMITGKIPPESLERLVSDELEIPNDLPENIKYVFRRGMAVRAAERISSAEELRDALLGNIKQPSIQEYKPVVIPNNSPTVPAEQRTDSERPQFQDQSINKADFSKRSKIPAAAAIIGGMLFLVLVVTAAALLFNARDKSNDYINNSGRVGTAAITSNPTQPPPTPTPTPIPRIVTYNSGYTYKRMSDIHSSAFANDAEFITLKNVITDFNNNWINFVNSSDRTVFKYLRNGTKAYDYAIKYGSKGITESYQLMDVNDVRKSDTSYYVWTHEIINEYGASEKRNEYHWVYQIKTDNGGYYVVDYTADPAY